MVSSMKIIEKNAKDADFLHSSVFRMFFNSDPNLEKSKDTTTLKHYLKEQIPYEAMITLQLILQTLIMTHRGSRKKDDIK